MFIFQTNYFNIVISNEDDIEVENPNVYRLGQEEIYSFPWQFPAQDVEIGLFPGQKYYWKLILFDDNDQIVGDFNEYIVNSFSINYGIRS